ncbi:MAG: NAD(P)H:quinone oxidoreductase [Pseudomonadota bacterium]
MTIHVLIAFYSRNGSTEALAEALADGARSVGAEVRLRRAREIVAREVMSRAEGWAEAADAMNARHEAPTVEDAEWADALVFGSPTRFGVICSELKAYVDSLGGVWARGALNGRVGGAFTSTSTLHGGNETTTLTMFNFMAHLGLILIPTGYADPVMFRGAGTPYGASAVTGQANQRPTDDDLAVARYQGRRVAQVARALKVLRAESAPALAAAS